MMTNLFLTPSLETESAGRTAAAIGHRGQDSAAIPRHFTNVDTSGARVFDLDGAVTTFFSNVFGHNISTTTRTQNLKFQHFRLGTSNTSTIVKGSSLEFVGDHNGHWYIAPDAYKVFINGSTVSGIVDGRSSTSDAFWYSTENDEYGGGVASINRFLSGNTATPLAPHFGFRSEQSLGLYRSGASTLALSYGTFSLRQGRLASVRTIATLGSSGNGVDTEVWFTVGASVATLNMRSGNTTYYFASSANTNV
jgi:hypothetical protein